MRTRSARAGVVVLGVVMAVLALSWAPAVRAGQALNIGYIPTDSQAALMIAADRYLPNDGFDVEMVRLQSGAAVITQVSTGQLQVGGGALGAAAYNAIAQGLPVKFVASLHNGFSEDYFTVRKSAWDSGELRDIAALRGKPVAVNAKGVATEWLLDQVLRQNGITLDDVDLKTMPFPDMVPALESGAIMAGIISEPFPTLAEDRGVGVRPFPRPANATPVPITMIFFNTDWATSNPDAANRFMVSYVKAARDLALNDGWKSEANLAIMFKYTGADIDVIRRARAHHIDPNLAVDQAILDAQQVFSRDRGYLDYGELLAPEQVFDWSYLEAALRQLGRV